MKHKTLSVCLILLIFSLGLNACSQGISSESEDFQETQIPEDESLFNGRAKSTYPDTLQPCACPFILPEGLTEGEDVECAYLFVPENREDTGSGQVRLVLAIFHRPEGELYADPVIYLSGGPGLAALESIHLHYEKYSKAVFAAGRDLIIFDQRGLGLSKPALDCPEYDTLAVELLEESFQNEDLQREKIPDLILESLKTCRQTLLPKADLGSYNSISNADDVEELRQALGYEAVNLWGISYGSRLALEVIRRHPEHLHSVILEGVFPPDVDLFSSTPANYWRSLQLLFASCEDNYICSRDYPDLEKVFFETVERLNKEPQTAQIVNPLKGEEFTARMDGSVLLALVFQILYDSHLRYLLPQIIYDASQNDFVVLNKVRASMLLTMQYVSRGMYLSVMCNEELTFSSSEKLRAELLNYPQLASLYSNNLQGELLFDICDIWGAGQAAPQANLAVSSDLPVLIFNGEFDPVTPPEWGERAAETLENSFVFQFPGIGHGASFVEGCPQSIFTAFLLDPGKKPDGACIEEMES